MKYYILYNPLAGHGNCNEKLAKLKSFLSGECVERDVTALDVPSFLSELAPEDAIVISGGDGTVNRFVNAVDCDKLDNDVWYYGSGSGNDFLHDLGGKSGDAPIKVNEYFKNLPTVDVEGKKYRFVNGIGYGLDGYSCEVGDRLKEKNKAVNYTSIAIKGILFHFKPANATVTVDGVTHSFKKVWIAPTMNGRFYGGGMMAVPCQQRLGSDEVSLMVFHNIGKIGILTTLPLVFKGDHVKKKNHVAIFKGKEVTVKFDRPTALQIDGETITGVTEYSVHSKTKVKA